MPSRKHEVSRLEGFSDAVFGFALTLLVVSLEVPGSWAQLMDQVEGFVGFALMFAMVCWIWYEHNKFFRRYGLQDAWTTFLNSVLLFVVLFYVYPLKFLTTALMNDFFGLGTSTGPSFRGAQSDGASLMLLYNAGVIAIFFTFVLLYQHARRKRQELGLGSLDEIGLKFGLRSHVISMSIGLVSLAIVLTAPGFSYIAGMIYVLMGPLHAWNGYQGGKTLELAQKKAAARA
jgi:uncharacterized membrane protein